MTSSTSSMAFYFWLCPTKANLICQGDQALRWISHLIFAVFSPIALRTSNNILASCLHCQHIPAFRYRSIYLPEGSQTIGKRSHSSQLSSLCLFYVSSNQQITQHEAEIEVPPYVPSKKPNTGVYVKIGALFCRFPYGIPLTKPQKRVPPAEMQTNKQNTHTHTSLGASRIRTDFQMSHNQNRVLKRSTQSDVKNEQGAYPHPFLVGTVPEHSPTLVAVDPSAKSL